MREVTFNYVHYFHVIRQLTGTEYNFHWKCSMHSLKLLFPYIMSN
jgi:hypothetical protein